MPRRGGGQPAPGFEQIAALVALHGSERRASAASGISRGTINGVLSGRHGIGQRTTGRLASSPDAERRQLVAESLKAGRPMSDVVAAARVRARQERDRPGTAEQIARAHQQAMRRQGLNPDGSRLLDTAGRHDSPARQASWETLLDRYRAGEIDFSQDKYAKRRSALEAADEDDISGMHDDDEDEEDDEESDDDSDDT